MVTVIDGFLFILLLFHFIFIFAIQFKRKKLKKKSDFTGKYVGLQKRIRSERGTHFFINVMVLRSVGLIKFAVNKSSILIGVEWMRMRMRMKMRMVGWGRLKFMEEDWKIGREMKF